MPAEARISPIWRKQKLFVAIFMMAIGGWFFFDGFIGYPRSNRRFDAYTHHEKEGRLAEWPAYATSKGWVVDPAKQPKKRFSNQDIIGQYVFGALGTIAGALLLIYWFTQKNRILRSDQEAVYTPAGTRVPFGAITGLGKKKWESKGIAVVRYELEGKKGQFLVDDYKFETEPTRQILREIEDSLTARTAPDMKPS